MADEFHWVLTCFCVYIHFVCTTNSMASKFEFSNINRESEIERREVESCSQMFLSANNKRTKMDSFTVESMHQSRLSSPIGKMKLCNIFTLYTRSEWERERENWNTHTHTLILINRNFWPYQKTHLIGFIVDEIVVIERINWIPMKLFDIADNINMIKHLRSYSTHNLTSCNNDHVTSPPAPPGINQLFFSHFLLARSHPLWQREECEKKWHFRWSAILPIHTYIRT